MRYLYLICFLIISCDLPSEANSDCNGDTDGSAQLDQCGICAGGDTGIVFNQSLDECGVCFGSNECLNNYECTDPEAINYYDNAQYSDNNLCMYDLCTDYFETYEGNCLESDNNPIYQIGDQLNCNTLNAEFVVSYPDCGGSTIKLADFKDKVLFLIYEEDW